MTGAFTKPVSTYRDDRDRRAYEESKADSKKPNGEHASEKKVLLKEDSASIKSSASATKSISAGQMASASAMSLAMFAPKALKGMTVDIPLAITDGLKNVPRAYGDTPRDHGPVTGFRTGATVAGKTFAFGFMDGLSDVVVQPYKGAQAEGAKGAVKGVGKGMANLVTKSGAGMFGLMGYTSAGIAKSLRTAMYSKTRKTVAKARHEEGRWLLQKSSYDIAAFADIIAQAIRK